MADHSARTEHLGQQALESYLWGAANLLRGLIDAGDDKQYVFPLLFSSSSASPTSGTKSTGERP